jgi:hypothetical protein
VSTISRAEKWGDDPEIQEFICSQIDDASGNGEQPTSTNIDEKELVERTSGIPDHEVTLG